ncbi:GNAT family N-acetyltransferase [Dokdonia sinensis]|uniref:GNAT family N-acetyltransferase n=1 Tax=Dokdonia sinensis TaxID=2479847 RepID=A0A3M0GFK1_9FLAO|nr:GNAT family N-acetyltransferase [Dokdonia sinensis]RMB63510.1 GNAT family N-acetyltransferase [Dokdonia sinensis]
MQNTSKTISQNLYLTPLTTGDQPQLFKLMQRIYPSAYGHYWKDDCSWYLESQYGKKNFEQELNSPGSEYYFVRSTKQARDEFREPASPAGRSVIGIFKIIKNCPYPPLEEDNALKVHRVYLDPAIQGQGIGKSVMVFAEKYAQKTGHSLIWLDAMDTHEQAQAFYKSLGYERSKVQHLDFPLLHDQYRPMWYMHKFL